MESVALHPLWFIVFASAVALIPIFIGAATSYLKVSIVLTLLKNGLGVQQVPSGLIVMVLSFAISAFVMEPTLEKSVSAMSSVDLEEMARHPSVKALAGFAPVVSPWREFMFVHLGEQEFVMLHALEKARGPETTSADSPPEELPIAEPALVGKPGEASDVSFRVLLAGFVLSEVKRAFTMGFVVLVPFLAIDLIVANVLAGLGMFMMSPTLIALPLKLLLFAVSDGWLLVTKGLILSYRG